MKNILLLSATYLCFVACSTTQKTPVSAAPAPVVMAPKPAQNAPFITWDKKMIDLGLVKKGEKKTMFFEFTNTSAVPVRIDIVDACDCTKVEFPRNDIAPGKIGRLDVVFNSAEKDTSETIGINVVFTNLDASGNPHIEGVEYKFKM